MGENTVKAVAILGCGRTARAMTAYLMSRGIAVTLWGRNPETVALLAAQGVSVTGCCAGEYRPTVTGDLAQAAACDYLFVMTTAGGHLPVARRLHGLLHAGQRILVFNGNWGAYEFWAELGEELADKEIIVAETGAMLFLADYADGHLHVKKIKDQITVASVPCRRNGELLRELAETFPQFIPEKNIACTSINNSNPVMHVPITLFNFSRMENGEDYWFYGKAASPSIVRFIEAADAERCNVAQAIGATRCSCLEIINSFWPQKYDTLYEAIKNNAAYQSAKGPVTLEHRYLNEDIPFGMAPVAALGKRYGVPTPCIDAMLTCAYAMLGDSVCGSPDFDCIDFQQLC